jgi:hypothetical protein
MPLYLSVTHSPSPSPLSTEEHIIPSSGPPRHSPSCHPKPSPHLAYVSVTLPTFSDTQHRHPPRLQHRPRLYPALHNTTVTSYRNAHCVIAAQHYSEYRRAQTLHPGRALPDRHTQRSRGVSTPSTQELFQEVLIVALYHSARLVRSNIQDLLGASASRHISI